MKPPQITLKKTLKISLIVIGSLAATAVAGVIIIIFIFGMEFFGRDKALNKSAEQNAKYMNSLVFFRGQHKTVVAAPDGDSLTGSGSIASVTYPVTGSAMMVEQELATNLAQYGYTFTHKYEGEGFNGDNSTDNTHINRLFTSAFKGSDELQFTYVMKDDYQCEPYQGVGGCAPNIVVDAGLINQQLTSVDIYHNLAAK